LGHASHDESRAMQYLTVPYFVFFTNLSIILGGLQCCRVLFVQVTLPLPVLLSFCLCRTYLSFTASDVFIKILLATDLCLGESKESFIKNIFFPIVAIATVSTNV
jgi:hypothetical protein